MFFDVKLTSFEAIVRALNAANVRYLVAGGVAVTTHGYLRYTKDVDLVVHLTPANVVAAFKALNQIGYRTIVPVTAEQFADPAMRAAMIRDKNMKVLQFFSDEHRETPVDVFVSEPFAFDDEYARAVVRPLANVGDVRVVTIETLIRMKEAVGRPQDLMDVEHLRARLEDRDKAP
jgi:hypothetical protein